MKNILLVSIIIVLLTGCKSRQVAIQKTDSTVTKVTSAIFHIKSTGIDTSKKSSATIANKNTVIHRVDSSGTITDIKPVAGTVVTVDADGTFHGQATSVQTTSHKNNKMDKTIQSDLQHSASQINGIDTGKVTDSNIKSNETVSVQTKIKDVKAEADHSWVYAVLGVALLVVAGLIVYFRVLK